MDNERPAAYADSLLADVMDVHVWRALHQQRRRLKRRVRREHRRYERAVARRMKAFSATAEN